MTSARIRKKRDRRQKQHAQPSAPRQIGANDNAPILANDNEASSHDLRVKETPGQRIFRQMQRRALDEASQPRPTYDPALLTIDQAKRARRADDRLKSDDPKKRAAAIAELLAIGEEVSRRVEAYRKANDNAELEHLEGLRGGVFAEPKRQEPQDRKRIASRDGLETLLTAHSITITQHAAGLRYRADYELLDPEKGLTPPAIDQTRKIVRGGDGWAQKRLERELFVRDLEAMIQDEDRSFRGANGRSAVEKVGRAVWALREVAGKGSNLLTLSSSGSVRASMSAALILALDCAAIAYGLERRQPPHLDDGQVVCAQGQTR
jgi:hypothetical protein